MERRVAPHSFFGVLSVVLALTAAGVHLWAGWEDEGRLVLRPVGHLTVLAAMAWLFAMVVAVVVAAFNRRGRMLALSATALCIIGVLLLVSR